MASTVDPSSASQKTEVMDGDITLPGNLESPETREGSKKDEAPEDTVKIQDHVEEITRSLEFIEPWERKLEKLVDLTSLRWRGQLEELGSSLASEVRRLRVLRENLAAQKEKDSHSDPESIVRTSTCELKYVSWKKTAHYRRTPPAVHCAIEVPFKEPTREELAPRDRQELDDSILFDEFLDEPPQGRKEVPERIVINSVRLNNFLDFNLYDGSLSWSSYGPFCILRPFKILVFYNDEIRSQLRELEQSRYTMKPATEEEYDAEWKLNPPDDSGFGGSSRKQVFNQMSISELTGLAKDLRSLIKFMDGYIQPALARNRLDSIFFWDLWYIFPAESLIYVKDKKIPQKIWKVIQRTGGRRYLSRPEDTQNKRDDWYLRHSQFVIDCFHLDFDGIRYVPTFYQIQLDPFEGSQPITSLSVLPLEVAEKNGFVDRQEVVDRGREFVKCTKPSHRDYRGRNQLLKPNGVKIIQNVADLPDNATKYSEWIESEVMVDFERALQEVPEWRPGGSELKLHVADMNENDDEHSGMDRDNIWDRKLSDRVIDQETEKWHKWDKDHPPREEEDLLLLPDRVFAFVFRNRKWACLQLGKGTRGEGGLTERSPRKEPWNDLQLPDGHKRLVQSLIESHSDNNTAKSIQFDLVGAKGKGVIILLHGVPGVGKTSTAECAAEANQKPLLPITCGDLGSTPREVESKLQEAFQLAQLWKCVLLLDEADIYLAQRNEDDIQRNALVSVFLRVLEYYEGILFLTTNRVGVFDEAFKSRIHMALYYPPLEWKYTQKIWSTHLEKLKRSGLVDLDQDDIMSYAEHFFEKQNAKGSPVGPVWNGRQIRNAFQSAVALAGFKYQGGKIRLEREHLQRVSSVSNEFNNYLWNIKCQSDADKASKWGYRYDPYRPEVDLDLRTTRTRSIDANFMPFGQSPIPNSSVQTSQQIGSNPLTTFQQQTVANSMGQSQSILMPNGLQNTIQPQAASGFPQQQYIPQQQQIQPQQQQQQLNFQPLMNQQGVHSAQANLQLQAQYSLNSGQQGNSGNMTGTMPENMANVPRGMGSILQTVQHQ